MIFPGFPGVLSFFQVFQVEWEPCQFARVLTGPGEKIMRGRQRGCAPVLIGA